MRPGSHRSVYVISGAMPRLYVAERDDAVKIGVSSDPQRRVYFFSRKLRQVRLAWVSVEGFPAAVQIESMAHQALMHCHIEGEWFATTVEEAAEAVTRAIELQAIAGGPRYLMAYHKGCEPRRSVSDQGSAPRTMRRLEALGGVPSCPACDAGAPLRYGTIHFGYGGKKRYACRLVALNKAARRAVNLASMS